MKGLSITIRQQRDLKKTPVAFQTHLNSDIVAFMKKFIYTLVALIPAYTNAIELGAPLLCGAEKCYIQTYVDHSSAPRMKNLTKIAKDYTCGGLAKKGYWSTDFHMAEYKQKDAPAVLAAASGKVIAVRRTMPDSITSTYTPYQIPRGREAGNSIIIKHENGFETQYSHLKFGSILVTEGQKVEKGEKIAEIGSSGQTVVPKLAFSVRENHVPVDPFAYGSVWKCGQSKKTLWDEETREHLTYSPTGIARAGFSNDVPDATRLRTGLGIEDVQRRAPRSVVFWADFYGLKRDDIVYMRIVDPTGQLFAEQETIARSDYPQWLGYVGRRVTSGAMTSGIYVAEIIVQRKGSETIISQFYEVELEGSRLPPSIPQIK